MDTVQSGTYHTNFSLAATGGEMLTLCSPSGEIYSRMPVLQQYTDMSYGRMYQQDGYFYFTTPTQTKAGVVTVRYALEGNRLRIVKAGEPIVGVDYARGYSEPSVAKLGDRYYLTIRTDEVGLFAESDDGYHFSTPKPWVWDDGEVLPNYNTMQRFIRHKDGLFLAYTRRGAHNDHVFRHRAPMFMTRFDEDRKCLIRSEEVILVPEMGTRLGNFSVTNISPTEEWLLTAEWMQPAGCEKYGSDNRIWLAKVKFSE